MVVQGRSWPWKGKVMLVVTRVLRLAAVALSAFSARGVAAGLFAFGGALIASAAADPARAQSGLTTKSELRSRQDALYQQLQLNPVDPTLMFAYARVSTRLDNHEGAIATLQRLLLFHPDNLAAKIELGALYFAVGSYPLALQFFDEALSAPNLPDASRLRIEAFLREIDRRTATHRFEGRATVGAIASTNATFGPDASRFDGVDGGEVTVERTDQEDIGGRIRLDALHSYDMDTPREERWDTEAYFDGRWWSDPDSLDFTSLVFRSGPILSLEPSKSGLRARPFVEAALYTSEDAVTQHSVGGGVSVRRPINDEFIAFGMGRVGWRTFPDDDSGDFDGPEGQLIGTVRYVPARNLAFRLTGLAEREQGQIARANSTAGGLQGAATFAYAAPFESVRQRWVVDLSARAIYRRFDAADPTIEVGNREQVDVIFGFSHRFQLSDNWALLAEIDYQNRSATAEVYEFDALTGGLSVTTRF